MKVTFGTATMTEMSQVRYLPWEDAFDVEFEDGICFLEPHAAIRTANGISKKQPSRASCPMTNATSASKSTTTPMKWRKSRGRSFGNCRRETHESDCSC